MGECLLSMQCLRLLPRYNIVKAESKLALTLSEIQLRYALDCCLIELIYFSVFTELMLTNIKD